MSDEKLNLTKRKLGKNDRLVHGKENDKPIVITEYDLDTIAGLHQVSWQTEK